MMGSLRENAPVAKLMSKSSENKIVSEPILSILSIK